ncbi:type II toxin-antitoxin system VapC family toxin [Rhodothermus marinus]|uniref:type II toxin-antitoxin system VapC family toxin n=1 Tax=Rhodothermus marinus TaxID=29549 RepID=UPI0012BA3D8C|nr:type II toxin-antitoxin system VapC family toxin [Rhodothermus marinus]BBM68884.1 hypothetical protein RmaAA213_07300 [Rhodothermus marinus]BBM71862.1 hypothetical protein RmaAA338_07270 [Rhodothermus marinus]
MEHGVVLDASALLAWLHDEPGGDQVEALLEVAVMSAVNWSEVLQKSLARGVAVEGLREDLEALGLQIEPFIIRDAEIAAGLWEQTRPLGLSLADRACLALGLRLGWPVVTADRAWQALGSQVRLIR